MTGLDELLGAGRPWLPAVAVAVGWAAGLTAAHRFVLRPAAERSDVLLSRQLAMLLATGLGLVVVILLLPVSDATRDQLLGLLGLVLTAVVAFASTTFVANAMAGVMLRSVGSFRIGDFVRVGDAFGRVTERGLFHVEIQTEDRDLTTLPNLYLVSNPTTVVRESGTIISATLSLGYDVPHGRVESALLEAGAAAGLDDPFVRVLELGDHAVHYRVAGFLREVKQLLAARSRLHVAALDALHAAGIEIASPRVLAVRGLPAEAPLVPDEPTPEPAPEAPSAVEEKIFDKAEEEARLARERELELEREKGEEQA